jgi:c-di-GMP-binding flagellar brake protein YcgR
MSDHPQHDPERRRYPRVKAKIPVEIHCLNSAPMRTSTDEVSLCGCYIESMFTMETGTRLALVFSCGDQKIATNAVVVTKYAQVGNGIDFIDITPEDRLKLREHLAQLEA